jgi:hypothetical protein
MRTSTGVKIGAVLALILFGLLTIKPWQAFPRIDTAPMRNRVTPSTKDGRWAKVIGTWTEDQPAYITIVAGDGVNPPGCNTGTCGGRAYTTMIQVKTGQEIIFTVQNILYKGGANCVILAPGEDYGAKVPAGARVDNHAGHDGRASCHRVVTW